MLLTLSLAAYEFGPPSTVIGPDVEFGLDDATGFLTALGIITATIAVQR